MSSTIEAEATISVGEEITIASDSPITKYAVVFEDDGETGYFYALDTSQEKNPILDALHIYNVSNVIDKDKPSLVQIVWSGDGLKAALWINDYPHAVFDLQRSGVIAERISRTCGVPVKNGQVSARSGQMRRWSCLYENY